MGNSSVEAFKRVLARMPADVRKNVWSAFASNVQQTANAIKASAPRDSGALADSVRITFDEPNLKATIRAGGQQTTRDGYDYSLGIEFSTTNMPAQPFFWKNYRLYKKSRRASVKKAMTKALKKHFPSAK